MNAKEKAKQIFDGMRIKPPYHEYQFVGAIEHTIKLTEQQFIDKACEWIESYHDNFPNIRFKDEDDGNYYNYGHFIAKEFRKTMKQKESRIVDTSVVKYKFLHCNKQKKVIEQMYGNEFNNFAINREKYLEFLNKVVADNRVEELNNILETMEGE